MKRLLVVGGCLIAALGTIALFLMLLSTSADTTIFATHTPTLIGLNVLIALALLVLVGWQLRSLWLEHRAQVFGSRLKLRLMAMFGLMAVFPGALVYGVSVQFVTRSIESWFDVRVEKSLEAGLDLGRTALDSMLADLSGRGRSMALELSSLPENGRRTALILLREQNGVQAVSLFSSNGQLLATANSDLTELVPRVPSTAQLKQARSVRQLSWVDSDEGKGMFLRVLVPVPGFGVFEEPRILQLTQQVPGAFGENAEAVEAMYRDYQVLQLARVGLTRIYALTLTLTLLVALFGAFALAFVLTRRLSAPLSILAEGTEAVAQGDFSPRRAIHSRDELGILTRSFNQMTAQLEEARRETEGHRAEVESARAYLESILANLSAGVLVFDRHFRLQTVNEGALTILGDSFDQLVGQVVANWTRQNVLGEFIQERFSLQDDTEWQGQLELDCPNGMPQILLLRGSRLPETSGGGDVVVFDDVTKIVAAQRSAAWGEVARRLAHEIKNPLTPIQLSAERLQHKLADKLTNGDAEMLQRSTQTIINQVRAMKHIVDDFRDYARLPAPELAALDLNSLVREVLGLYETSSASIETSFGESLLPVMGDATQIRQVIHNLLRNAEDALEGRENAVIQINTETCGRMIRLRLTDNGAGFSPDLLARVFEPYITTKTKGTGLGLPIVKKIIDEHHGTIKIGNAEQGGAEIDIRLPQYKEEENDGDHSGR